MTDGPRPPAAKLGRSAVGAGDSPQASTVRPADTSPACITMWRIALLRGREVSGICRHSLLPPGVSGRDAHHLRLVGEPDAELPLHAGPHFLRERQQVRTGAAEIHQCERVTRGDPRSDRKSTRLNSSHLVISYAVFCL